MPIIACIPLKKLLQSSQINSEAEVTADLPKVFGDFSA
jgi:hypothetical protein